MSKFFVCMSSVEILSPSLFYVPKSFKEDLSQLLCRRINYNIAMKTGKSFSYMSNADTMADAFDTQVYFLTNQLKGFYMINTIQSHIPFFRKSIQCEPRK